MKTNLSPIVLFVYNRPHHTIQTIETLQKNELAKESELFIYSDGAKSENDKPKVNEVREHLQNIDGFKAVHIIEREKNYGLADNIISGVTEIVNRYGSAIVLEDDIVTNPYFLKYMNKALEFYKDEDRVMHVSGYLYPTLDGKSTKETFFLNVATCWGWGTWRRAWNHLIVDCEKLINLIPQCEINRFNLEGGYDWYRHLILNSKNQMNTWAIKWYASFFIKDGFCLHPKYTLTKNIGTDGSGVHCGINETYSQQNCFNAEIKIDKISIIENEQIRKDLKIFFTKDLNANT